MPSRRLLAWLFLSGLLAPTLAVADDAPATAVKSLLVVERSGGGRGAPRRALVQADPVMAAVVAGTFQPPKAGDTVSSPNGPARAWSEATAGDDGVFKGAGFQGGYSFANLHEEAGRIAVLNVAGHGGFWINGEPHAGDAYNYGYMKIPVKLRAGDNALLIRNGRGSLRVSLAPPRAAAQIETADATLPDLIVGRDLQAPGAVVVLNAADATTEGLVLRARVGDGPVAETPVPPLLPLSSRKVGFVIDANAVDAEGEAPLHLSLVHKGETIDEAKTTLRVRPAGQSHKVTFVSSIDGSVQYYGFVPASNAATDPKPGLILSLHGASVEGIGQAAVYSPRPWAHVVAPTNRRPYGFDWEDWGRVDAMEVLDIARLKIPHDPRKVWLTGHSMGGHGTWHVGVTFPDRFAAIAPSAGWVSMTSYAGLRAPEPDSPVAALLGRASLPSDTLALARNLDHLGVYVLHGSADDNVPVGQARRMREALGAFHPDFAYYERPGAGHWWGNECCDWPPLMDFLRARELPDAASAPPIDFVTAAPSVSSQCHWAEIKAQEKPFVLSEMHLKCDASARRVTGTTTNVRRLVVDLWFLDGNAPVEVSLDGTKLSINYSFRSSRIWLSRGKDGWTRIDEPSTALKNPRRAGPFKEAFRNNFQLVYATKGTPEENAWAMARARFDAERFWYQGNGSVDVIPDTAFRPEAEPFRNVILYGHADSNAAWPALLADSPVQVNRGAVRVGERRVAGDDLACLFLRPRPIGKSAPVGIPGYDTASVGVVAGTGPSGLRLTTPLSYFTSGVALPDLVVLSAAGLPAADPVVAAGFFGDDWSVDSGEFAWRE